jgi:hypothetical protein
MHARLVRRSGVRNRPVEALWKRQGPRACFDCVDSLDQCADFRVDEEAFEARRRRHFVNGGFLDSSHLHSAIGGEVPDEEADEVKLRGAEGLALDERRDCRGCSLAMEEMVRAFSKVGSACPTGSSVRRAVCVMLAPRSPYFWSEALGLLD